MLNTLKASMLGKMMKPKEQKINKGYLMNLEDLSV